MWSKTVGGVGGQELRNKEIGHLWTIGKKNNMVTHIASTIWNIWVERNNHIFHLKLYPFLIFYTALTILLIYGYVHQTQAQGSGQVQQRRDSQKMLELLALTAGEDDTGGGEMIYGQERAENAPASEGDKQSDI